jgi:DNA-binding beta-propeller fold protein YncE
MSAQAARSGQEHRPGARRRARGWCRALALAGGLLCLLGPGAPLAHAARPRALKETIGSAGSGAGEMRLRAAGEGVAGSGIAVQDETSSAAYHDIYIADTGNHRIDQFDPTKPAGEQFVRSWGWGVAGGIGFEECTPASLGGCTEGASGTAPGEFQAPAFIAVDDSPGGEGDLYVADTGDDTITKFTAEGALMKTWGTNGQLNGSTTKAGSFGEIAGIAVNPANGTLYILNTAKQLFELEPNATQTNPETEVNLGVEPRGLALDTNANGFYTIYPLTQRVLLRNAAGESFGEVHGLTFASAVAAPDAGELFVAEPGVVKQFGVNGSGEAEEPAEETFGEGSIAASAGVAVDPTNENIYVADAAGRVDVFALEAVSPPLVVGASVTEVTHDSVRFSAEINPRSLAGEAVTEYGFEYGPCATPTTCVSSLYPGYAPGSGTLAPAFEVDTVGLLESVEGLEPGVTYHYRALAHNAQGSGEGPEQMFKTPGAGALVLPDARQWQMVSPVNKLGSLIEPIGGGGDKEGVIQAAADGHAITYLASSPTEPSPAGSDNYVQVLSSLGPEGWQSRDLTFPHAASTEVTAGTGYEYRGFSEGLSRAAVQPFGPFTPCTNALGVPQPCISPEASEQTAFIEDTETGLFTPLVTGCPSPQEQAEGHPCPKAVEEHADVPPGSIFGQGECVPSNPCGPLFDGASADYQHVILGELQEWNAEAPPAEQLRQLSLLPPNGADEVLAAGSAFLGNGATRDGGRNVRRAVSSDGSRVVWEGEGQTLYLRLNATEPQSPVSEGKCADPADACTTEIGVGEYQTANTEDTRVFYTAGGGLYEYDLGEPEGHRVSELAGGIIGAVIGASEDGSYVYFVSNSQITEGSVSGACETGTLEEQARALCNLYVRHDGVTSLVAVLSGNDKPDWGYQGDLEDVTARVSPDGRWLAFMSQRRLTGYDNQDADSGHVDEEVFLYHAPETPAGAGTLACASCNPTGARPHGTEYGIDGNGANPGLPLAGGDRVWPGTTWIAANVPGWTAYKLARAAYESRFLADSGRLFFNSVDGLVPKDTNGTVDVYEYEPVGVGPAGADCGPGVSGGGEVFKPEGEVLSGVVEPAGCVGLISSGTASGESAFLDASESGGDVFFLTGAKLVAGDVDTSLDVYDAHECTSLAPCLPESSAVSPACSTEASCKAAPSVQPEIYGAPESATFSGAGNPVFPRAKPKTTAEVKAEKLAKALKACKKDRSKKKRVVCERKARKQYGASAPKARRSRDARRATSNRRAGR